MTSIRPAALLDRARGAGAGPVAIGAEASLTAKTGEQNALVFDTPMGQSSVINFKKGGVWYWQINCSATNPPTLSIVALQANGTPVAGAAPLTVAYTTKVVDFAVAPTVLGAPVLMQGDLGDLIARVEALESEAP